MRPTQASWSLLGVGTPRSHSAAAATGHHLPLFWPGADQRLQQQPVQQPAQPQLRLFGTCSTLPPARHSAWHQQGRSLVQQQLLAPSSSSSGGSTLQVRGGAPHLLRSTSRPLPAGRRSPRPQHLQPPALHAPPAAPLLAAPAAQPTPPAPRTPRRRATSRSTWSARATRLRACPPWAT
jgi:hypothetical protein